MVNPYEVALEDFPKSEIWRLQTDGWQSTLGPRNFRPAFYQGMDEGFRFISEHYSAEITPELLEAIYHKVNGSERDYQQDTILQKGYCERANSFELVLPLPGLEHHASVSELGMDELARVLQECEMNKGARNFPQLEIEVIRAIGGFSYYHPSDFENIDAFKNEMLRLLRLAGACKAKYEGEKTPLREMVKIQLLSNTATRAEILGFVANDISRYYHDLALANAVDNPEQRKAFVVMAINGLVRKLLQSHYFPDANGRTFVFVLANLLLLQNGLGLKITENPVRFAAYSSYELLVETMADMEHFNSYKITIAKNYICQLTADVINSRPDDVSGQILFHLNPRPLIALAQLDELYSQIKTGHIRVPKGYGSGSYLSGIFSRHGENSKARHIVKNIIKELYFQTLRRTILNETSLSESERIGYGSLKEKPEDILKQIADRHFIAGYIDLAARNEMIETCFAEQSTHEPAGVGPASSSS
ncbi:hypothetical protein [Legionella sp. CNM-4043-24]|uniref:hypothetical protein n=1 Tax=Legionella sp. CNM-4043-24 TaxID=3421646 RepID=UPI00403ABE64